MRRLSWTCGLALCGFVLSIAGCTSSDSTTQPVGKPGNPQPTNVKLPEKDKKPSMDEEPKKEEDKKKDGKP